MFDFYKYHTPCRSLQNRSNYDGDGRANIFLAIFDDNHSTIVEVPYTLIIFFTGLDDQYFHMLSRNPGRLQCIGQIIDIQDNDTLQRRYLIQIIVISHDFGVDFPAQPDQFGINALHIIKIIIDDTESLDAWRIPEIDTQLIVIRRTDDKELIIKDMEEK